MNRLLLLKLFTILLIISSCKSNGNKHDEKFTDTLKSKTKVIKKLELKNVDDFHEPGYIIIANGDTVGVKRFPIPQLFYEIHEGDSLLPDTNKRMIMLVHPDGNRMPFKIY